MAAVARATATASTATIWLAMPTIWVPSDSTTESGRMVTSDQPLLALMGV